MNNPYAASNSSPCWRIISINSDGSITIVRDQGVTNQAIDKTPNLDHATQPNTLGYNDLLSNAYRGNSLMYDRLYGTSGYQNTTIMNYQHLLQPLDACLNKVNSYVGINSSSYAGSANVKDTCNIIDNGTTRKAVNPLRNQYVRLPYLEEYLNASLETSTICTADYQYQCRGKNFMYNKQYYWSLNGYASNSWDVRLVYVSGTASLSNASGAYGVRPVVNLKSAILFTTGGTGTVDNPYIIGS